MMDSLVKIDQLVFLAVNSLAGRAAFLDGLWVFFSTVLIFFMFGAFAVYFLTDRKKRLIPFFSALTGSLFSLAVSYLIGILYYRPRPFLELGAVRVLIHVPELSKSFPSSHAATVFGLAFGLYLWNHKWGMAFLVMASLVALGRVLVGVHYPSDVAAGALLGGLCALLIHRLTHFLFGKEIKEIIV